MKKIFGLLITLFILLLSVSEANAQVTRLGFYPDMYSYQPRTILIMPCFNRTDRSINMGKIMGMHTVSLAERGYYIVPFNIIEYYMQTDSMECMPDLDPIPCIDFHTRFGIDAILFISIKAWDKDFSESLLYEEFEYSLVSAIDGKEIWFYDILMKTYSEVPKDVSEKSYPFWTNTSCGIFTTIIASAIATKFSNYNKTAEEACHTALQNIPAGKYNERFQLDSLEKITVKAAWKKQKFGNRLTVE
jgi:hypothetical protein